MSAPNRETFSNDAQDVLNGAIDASQTSIVVIDGSEFPSTGNFRIRIENEVLICTARSGNTLTVVRGQEGTTGASHSDSSVVTHVLTAASFQQHVKDNVAMAGGLPVFKLVADDGSTLLTASDFTWRNQGGAARTDQNGSILLTVPTNALADNQRILERATPSPPYSYIAAFRACFPLSDTTDLPNFGMGLLDSATGENTSVVIIADSDGCNQFQVTTYATPTGGVTNHRTRKELLFVGPEIWIKVEDDNTDLKFYIGDGLAWVLVWSAGRTTQMPSGPNRVIWFGNTVGDDFDCFIRLLHWSRAS